MDGLLRVALGNAGVELRLQGLLRLVQLAHHLLLQLVVEHLVVNQAGPWTSLLVKRVHDVLRLERVEDDASFLLERRRAAVLRAVSL